jgi:SNF2 family DNA or RNA helicase
MTTPALIPAAPERTLTITPNGQAQFRFGFEPELIEALKAAVVGVSWNGTMRAWTVRARAANIRAINRFAQEHGFSGASEGAETQERIFGAVKQTMIASRAPDAEFAPPSTLAGTLRPFQRAGVAYAVAQAHGCLIADEMGLGKTVQAIATLETLGAFPAIIVCPASLKLNWEKELAAWLPHRSVRVVDGKDTHHEKRDHRQTHGARAAGGDRLLQSANGPLPRARNSAAGDHSGMGDARLSKEAQETPQAPPEILILNYDILPRHVDALRKLKPQAVVFDEGHLLKTAKSARSIAARKLRKGVKVRLLLTGTPVLNSPSELLNPLTILGRLDDLGGFWHFVERYCGGKEVVRTMRGGETKAGWDITGSSNLPELAARLRATCMVRRRKKDVLLELPAKSHAMLPVEITTRAEYDTAQRDVLEWVAKRAGRDPEFRAAIAHLDDEQRVAAVLRRAQNAVDRAAQAEELVKIEALKQISARGKLKAAQEWIENFLATGEKLVCFAWHQEILDALAKATGAPVISGETPIPQRQRLVEAFQRGEIPLILMNLQAGGVGLTLTAASNVLLLELPWTRALLDQAIDRCHRIGQRRAVTAWLMLGRRTIDHAIWKMIARKHAIAEGATG